MIGNKKICCYDKLFSEIKGQLFGWNRSKVLGHGQ